VHGWNTFGAQTSHRQTLIHNTHHNPDLGEATTFPFIVFFVLGHGDCTQMSFCLGTPKLGIPKFLKLKLLQLWRLITFSANLRLKWSLKQSCSNRQDLFNNMLHVTYTQINQCNFLFLMVGSQIDNLTYDPSFGHNLYFMDLDGSYEPSLDIHVPRDFQWYKDPFDPMNFDPCNRPLNIREPIGT
jgi:hypothetical protein